MIGRIAAKFRSLGPGLILAAAGIGAGDVVVASMTGLRHGYLLLWALVAAAALKYALSEALARWQLATGETIVRAWITRLPRWVSVYFGAYLLLWTFLVGASLSSACGLAAASLFPVFDVPTWGAIHAIVAAVLVASNRYARFQLGMKLLIALMAVSVLASAVLARPDPMAVAVGLVLPRLPSENAGAAVLALLGGIGGSLTVVCYAYWLRAAGWSGVGHVRAMRADLRLAYVFTALFGVALVVVAAGVQAPEAKGTRLAIELAARLAEVAGPSARWIFLVGFWCTVFAAMCGVWQGVPHVYVDCISAWRGRTTSNDRVVYLSALGWIALPPLVLLWFKEPVGVVVTFSIVGAFFMPFLAATLLYLNNRREWMGQLANRALGNIALAISLVLFAIVCAREVWTMVRG